MTRKIKSTRVFIIDFFFINFTKLFIKSHNFKAFKLSSDDGTN